LKRLLHLIEIASPKNGVLKGLQIVLPKEYREGPKSYVTFQISKKKTSTAFQNKAAPSRPLNVLRLKATPKQNV